MSAPAAAEPGALDPGAHGAASDEKGIPIPYVWYGSYGSNMWEDRFLCYIRGGKVEGMKKHCLGCRDPSPPLADTWVAVPHRSWFGRTRTATWGDGGVCFLDPFPCVVGGDESRTGHTLLRLYKITLEQFNDVVAQENSMHFSEAQGPTPVPTPTAYSSFPSGPPQNPTSNVLPSSSPSSPLTLLEKPSEPLGALVPLQLIQRLRTPPPQEANSSGPANHTLPQDDPAPASWPTQGLPDGVRAELPPLSWPAFHEVIPGGWYGTVLYLGDLDGSPILTFTCNEGDAKKFLAGKLPVNPPSASYRHVVARGLTKAGFDELEVQEYIDLRTRPLHQ